MKKLLIIISILLFTFSCKSVQTTTENKKVETPLANSLLWKITGKNLKEPSYLYGTIHLTCDYQLKDKVKKALDETTQLALEIDMDDPQLQNKTMQGMMMKDGQSIDKLLTPEEYKKLSVFFKKHTGMPLDMLKTMKPFMLSSLITMKLVDCPAPVAYEDQFMKIVKKDNEEVIGLESIESQLEIFDKIPYKEQLNELLKMVDEGIEKSKEEFNKLNIAYANEDLKSLYSLMEDSDSMEVEHNDLLLDNRNKNWIPVIGKFASEKSTFFGVGAMHLPGENGVIKLLRKEGYKVEPIL